MVNKYYTYEFLVTGIIDFCLYENLRDIIIIPLMVGKEYEILNGCNKIKVLISKKMIGLKLGEFVFNRSIGDIHSNKKKKKGKVKKKK